MPTGSGGDTVRLRKIFFARAKLLSAKGMTRILEEFGEESRRGAAAGERRRLGRRSRPRNGRSEQSGERLIDVVSLFG